MQHGNTRETCAPAQRRRIYCLPAILLLIATSACRDNMLGILEDDPPQIRGAVVTDKILNPVASGESTSVVVRIYQLTDDTAFGQQDFFSIYNSAEQSLGSELVNVEEIIAVPDNTKLMPLQELDATTTHIGVLVAFRDWERSVWRALIKTPADEKTNLKIYLRDSSVTLTSESKRWWKQVKKQNPEG